MVQGERCRFAAAFVVVATVVLAACGEAGNRGVTALQVGAATVATGSFRVEVQTRTSAIDDPESRVTTTSALVVIDLARDRSRINWTVTRQVAGTTRPPEDHEQITIGGDRWFRTVGATNVRPWLHMRRPVGSPVLAEQSNPAAALDRLRGDGAELHPDGSEKVRDVDTDRYAVVLPRTVTTTDGSEFVEDGFHIWVDAENLVRRLVVVTKAPARPELKPPVPARTIEQKLEFFDFGVQEEIEPPPPDQVLNVPTPSCASFSTQPPPSSLDVGCTGPPGEPTTTTLPAPSTTLPASASVRSTLQFRPVVEVLTEGCPAMTAQPDPEQPVRLPVDDGNCYDLGPSELTVTRASVSTTTSPDDSAGVGLTLEDADAAALDRLAEKNVGRQVAMVIFGRVVSAPVVQQPAFGGRAQISGLDAQTASDIAAALG